MGKVYTLVNAVTEEPVLIGATAGQILDWFIRDAPDNDTVYKMEVFPKTFTVNENELQPNNQTDNR